MYGGLFGDLPAAKGETNDDNDSQDKKDDSKAIVKTEDHDDPHTKTKKRRVVEEPKKSSSSVLQSLGVAGTSMAFVPSHVNRKQRQNTTTNVSHKKPSSFSQQQQLLLTSSNSASAKPAAPILPVAAMELASWKEEPQLYNSTVTQEKHVHGTSTTTATTDTTTVTTITTEEPEAVRRLHESVTDPYDPLVPNDLLQYWERQAAMQERRELEREANETIKSQARVRQQLYLERQALEQAGDVDKLVEHRTKRNAMMIMSSPAAAAAGRGRGRGVSNLPAWLVAQQKKEADMRDIGHPKNEQ